MEISDDPQLASIDGPLANDTINFGYDELGRVNSRSINGTANSQTWTFDALGRLSGNVNKLGSFGYTYYDGTNRLRTLNYPSGQTGSPTANYIYFDNSEDRRLQQIKNLTSTQALLSQFDYTYDDEGQIKTWTKSYPGLSPAPQRLRSHLRQCRPVDKGAPEECYDRHINHELPLQLRFRFQPHRREDQHGPDELHAKHRQRDYLPERRHESHAQLRC